MKGKKILTLVSAAMGLAIVGSTFAAWAVTDNADPFGIKVSPGKIGPDETKFVTLSYGQSTFGNVDNLKSGSRKLAGSVFLKVETSDEQPYPGSFDIALQDQSNANSKLLSYLSVAVYDKEITVDSSTGEAVIPHKTTTGHTDEEIDPIGSIPFTPAGTETLSYEASIEIFVPHGEAGKQVWAVVGLAPNLDVPTMEEISKDVVYLEMDWNKSKNSDYPTTDSTMIYLNYGTAGKDVYCYAWGNENKNKDYPGVAMTDMGGGYYSYTLNLDFNKLIFNIPAAKEGDPEVFKTEDLTVTKAGLVANPTFTPASTTGSGVTGTWGAKPDESLTKDYYVVGAGDALGKWSPVEANGMTVDPNDAKHYTKQMTFNAGDEFKVCSKNKMTWFTSVSTWDGCGFTISTAEGHEGNIVVTNAGTYTVNLYLEGDGGNCITLGLPVQA